MPTLHIPTCIPLTTRPIHPRTQSPILHSGPRVLAVDELDEVLSVRPSYFTLFVAQVLVEVLEEIRNVEDMACFALETTFPWYAFVEVVEEELVLWGIRPALGEGAGRCVEGGF